MQSLEAAYVEGDVTPSLCDCFQYKMVCTHNKPFKKAKISTTQCSHDTVPTFHHPPDTSTSTTLTSKSQFCIHTKLLELYLEECAKDPNKLKTGLKCNTHLLDKLVTRERLNIIILNLYPGTKGYSISFPSRPLTDKTDTAEMIQSEVWSYKDSELLRYLDLEELPAFIVDLLEPQFSFLFYSGCIIAQVRDFRRTFPTLHYDSHHVLMRPTQQSILADVQKIADEHKIDAHAQIESQILLAHHPTLCLDVGSSSVATRTTRIHHNRHILNTHRIRRAAAKYSLVAINRRKRLKLYTHRPGLELLDYMNRLRTRPKPGLQIDELLRRPLPEMKPIPATVLEQATIEAPLHHISEIKPHPPSTHDLRTSEDIQPQLVEEYVLETDIHSKDAEKRRIYHIKLSILQRPLDGEYLGELYLDRDHRNGEHGGVACRFSLGTRLQAKRYIEQFTEIFTEGGQKPVRVHITKFPHSQNVQQNRAPNATNATTNLSSPNLSMSYQTLSGANSIANRTVNLLPAQQSLSASVPLLQTQLQQANKQTQDVNTEHAINILGVKRLNAQIQAGTLKQPQIQELQSPKSANVQNAALINILNRTPANNVNSDAIVNAMNNSQLLTGSPQVQTKLLGRKFTVSNMPTNARVLNAANVISLNSHRTFAPDLAGLQTQQSQIAQSNVGSSSSFFAAAVPKTAQHVARIAPANDSTLLMGTTADRSDLLASANPLLLEKLVGTTSSPAKSSSSPTFLQSPKQFAAVQSPLSSPTTQTINIQSSNFTPLQGVQNVQFQLLVSVPVTTSANSGASTTGVTQCVNNNNNNNNNNSNVASSISVSNVGTPTVVLATNSSGTNLAQLVTTGMKRSTQGTVLAATQNSTGLQLLSPMQPNQDRSQTRVQQLQPRQVRPITIKMATAGTAVGAQSNVTQAAQNALKKMQLQQQVQLQLSNQQQYHHHQQSPSQTAHLHLNSITRRSSQNVTDPP